MDFREFMRFHFLKALLGLVAVQIIIITIVQNYNRRPVANRDTSSVIEGRTVKVTPLSNDTDKDKTDELAVQQISQPIHGSATLKGNVVIYNPEAGFVGDDSLSYSTTDKRKESNNAYIFIKVNKNLEPLAQPDQAEVYIDGFCYIDVLNNDKDLEQDSIFISEFKQPLYGKIIQVKNQLVYQAANSSNVTDSFMYAASDGKSVSQKTTVKVTVKSKSDPCYPWLSNDLGDVAIPGTFSVKGGKMAIQASGSDIWGNADGFRFTYQMANSDCEISARVESLEASHEWSKAGVMIRASLNAGSPLAMVFASSKNGINTHFRVQYYDQMQGGENNREGAAPWWIKIVRKGNIFSYFNSANGKDWKPLGTSEINMPDDVYIGFAVCSHNNGELGKAVFSNYRMEGKAVK